MEYRFSDWLSCPACDEHDEVSVLTHETELVAECYSCGQISEFVIGEDIPLNGLDLISHRVGSEQALKYEL